MKTNTLPRSSALVFLQAVAAALPGTWRAALHEAMPRSEWEGALIREGDNLTIRAVAGRYGETGRISLSHTRKRNSKGEYIEVWGDREKGENPGRMDDPTITVSQDKSAEKVAADIAKRLLTDAEKIELRVRERIEAADRHENKRVNFIRAVCAAAGEEPRMRYGSGELSEDVSIYLNNNERANYHPSARAKVRADYAEFTVEVRSEARAAALIRFLRSDAYLRAGE